VKARLKAAPIQFQITDLTPRHRVRIDKKPVEVGNQPFYAETLPPGKHTVTIEREGFESLKKTVTVLVGKPASLSAKLKPLEGYLTVQSTPKGAILEVKGGDYVPTQFKVQTPLTKQTLPMGQYTMTLTKSGYQTIERTVMITPKRVSTVKVKMKIAPVPLKITEVTPQHRIKIDKKSVAVQSPIHTALLLPGKHTITISRDGFEPRTQKITIVMATPTSLSAALKMLQGYLTVDSEPEGATVQIKGGDFIPTEQEVQAPFSKKELPIGRYTLNIGKTGYEAETRSVTIKKQKTISVDVLLKVIPVSLTIKALREDFIEEGDGTFILDIIGKKSYHESKVGEEAVEFKIEVLPGNYTVEVSHSSNKYMEKKQPVNTTNPMVRTPYPCACCL